MVQDICSNLKTKGHMKLKSLVMSQHFPRFKNHIFLTIAEHIT